MPAGEDGSLHVLVLAEEAPVAGDLCGLLNEAFPHWSVAGGTFAEAADRVAAGETSVALLDLRAGAADPEVVSRLTGAFPSLPIVVIGRDPEQGEAARRLGAQEYWEGDPGSGRGLGRALRHVAEHKRVADSLRQLQAAVDTMQLGVSITDGEGRIVYLNAAEAEMHGYTVPELLGQDARNLSPREQWKTLPPRALTTVRKWKRERVRIRKDGSRFPVQLMSDVVTDAAGRPWGLVTTCEDISERFRAEEALRDSEERYALAVRGTNDGIWDWDVREQRIYLSPRWKAMLGYGEWDLTDSPEEWFSRIHPEDRPHVDEKVRVHLEGRSPNFEDEYRMRHRDGTYRFVLSRGFAVRDGEGKPTRMAGAHTDVTDRRAYDPLTGLPNRALFGEKLEQSFDRASRRSGYFFAVIFLDLDRFKAINDSLGHLTGDAVLIAVAKRLLSCLRPGDTVARFAGDEFAILLDRIADVDDASLVADRILKQMETPVTARGREVALSASMGISLSTSGYARAEELLRDADAAMYSAKRLGRRRYQLFDDALRERMAARAHMEDALQRALRHGEFRLAFQPVFALAPRVLRGFEALLRWPAPDGRVLLPAEFLPVAESTGQILSLGLWALREACRQMQEWLLSARPAVHLTVSVNLSPRQIGRRGIVEDVEAVLRETGLPAERLRLEITEKAFDQPDVMSTLSRLATLGVAVDLDDFGTGMASLAHLERFPIAALKLDRPLVGALAGTGGAEPMLVRSILAVARMRGIRVVAEGVETEEELRAVIAQGCDEAQGNLLAPPLTPEAVRTMIGTPAA
jgi:diguanylate cyclase (GGDEF)-like protein/PAS domain S-box-containing protein